MVPGIRDRPPPRQLYRVFTWNLTTIVPPSMTAVLSTAIDIFIALLLTQQDVLIGHALTRRNKFVQAKQKRAVPSQQI